MLECLIIGDSIAKGIATHRPECVAYAEVGISTKKFLDKYKHIKLEANTIIISLSTNDGSSNSYQSLFELRNKITAKQVYWIAPSETKYFIHYYNVNIVAGSYTSDSVVIPNSKKLSADKIHPTVAGYIELANKTK
jgi:lysophospholipase L1-like esterase